MIIAVMLLHSTQASCLSAYKAVMRVHSIFSCADGAIVLLS